MEKFVNIRIEEQETWKQTGGKAVFLMCSTETKSAVSYGKC